MRRLFGHLSQLRLQPDHLRSIEPTRSVSRSHIPLWGNRAGRGRKGSRAARGASMRWSSSASSYCVFVSSSASSSCAHNQATIYPRAHLSRFDTEGDCQSRSAGAARQEDSASLACSTRCSIVEIFDCCLVTRVSKESRVCSRASSAMLSASAADSPALRSVPAARRTRACMLTRRERPKALNADDRAVARCISAISIVGSGAARTGAAGGCVLRGGAAEVRV